MRAIHVPILAAIALALTACDSKVSEGMNPGECTDGADNDGNGAFDCDDPGCSSSPDCEEDGSTGDGTGGDPGTSTGGDPGTGTGGGTGDPGGGTGGDPGGGTGDPGGGTGGDPGGGTGDPGGGTGGDPGGGTGDPGGGTGGDPGGGTGDPGGGTGGDPGGGTGGTGGTGGGPGGGTGTGGGTAGTGGTGGTGGSTGGGTGGGPGAYDGAYIGLGGITLTLSHPSLGSDSCTGDFDIELFGTNVIDGNVSNCTLTGALSAFGGISSTISGTVDASGNVSAQFDTLGSLPFTGTSDGTNFTSTVSDSFVASGATVTVTGTITASK